MYFKYIVEYFFFTRDKREFERCLFAICVSMSVINNKHVVALSVTVLTAVIKVLLTAPTCSSVFLSLFVCETVCLTYSSPF